MDNITHREKVKETIEIANKICNDWECGFIKSMLLWEGEYTGPQKKVIDDLYERACLSPY